MRRLNSLPPFSILLILILAMPVCAVAGPTDAQISNEITAMYQQNATLRLPSGLRVQTLHRIVYLSGLVDTELQRQTAETIARAIPDVDRIVDSIAVTNQ